MTVLKTPCWQETVAGLLLAAAAMSATAQDTNGVTVGQSAVRVADASTSSPRPPPTAVPMVEKAVAARMTPYLFGSLGVAHDSVIHITADPQRGVAASDRQRAAQWGWGMQFHELLGAEIFVQGGLQQRYPSVGAESVRQAARAFGARITLGVDLSEDLRVFGKAGLARVVHSGRGTWAPTLDGHGYSNRQSRSALGLGLSYRLSGQLALRADADHIFKRRNDRETGWGNLDYFGLGLQYAY